ncbi:MAG: hypothetical protein ABIW76_04615 [Fibrobacteria bacterium]
MKNGSIGIGGMKASGAGKMKWAAMGFLAFLGLDLLLFGNCVIPPEDASAVPVKPGVVQVGVQGLALLGIAVFPSAHVRTGINGVTDLGFHADIEVLEPGGFAYIDEEGGEGFHGSSYLALGFDVKRAILGSDGKPMLTLQAGLTEHSAPWIEETPAAFSGMAGVLFGNESIYGGPRVHVGIQTVPFYQVELPLGGRFKFFHEQLALELGIAPSMLFAKGYHPIPWPYQYMGLQWHFGKQPGSDRGD